MRPVSLEIQGLTSFKEKQVIPFSDLDLFAITGPTGAGKTSIVDALTYALFGKVPRVDRDMKQLISQESERLSVSLQFANGGEMFRVHRATARKGLPVIRLERLVDASSDEWCAEANGATEVTQRVEELLGMDYEGFVRSVLLPQGQFEKFLAGKPEERRRVLDGLLRLNIYAEMMTLANSRKVSHQQTVEKHQYALQQYDGATPSALAAAQQELSGLRERADELAAERSRLTQASEVGGRLSASAARAREAREAIGKAEADLNKARTTLATGQEAIDVISGELSEVEVAIAASPFDADTLNQLTRAEGAYREMTKAEEHLTTIRERSEGAAQRLEQAQQAFRVAGQAAADTQAALAKADRLAEDARRNNAAAALRRGLKSGDPCPVCGQPVGKITVEDHATLDEAAKALTSAQAEFDRASKFAREAETSVAVAETEVNSISEQVNSASAAAALRKADLDQVLGDHQLSASQVSEGIREQNDARLALVDLNQRKDRLSVDRSQREQDLQSARVEVTALEVSIQSHGEQLAESEDKIKSDGEELRAFVRDTGWNDVAEALQAAKDPAPIIRSRRTEVDNEDRNVQQRIGSLTNEITRIQEGMEKSASLEEAISNERSRMMLAADLASLLKTTEFPSYIRGQALRLLAQDGSRQLAEISGGRYEFAVENQDFLVSDRWNAGETRSVRTLSGGETFIASLALALALAERLPRWEQEAAPAPWKACL
jgi:exonuclease SbcC